MPTRVSIVEDELKYRDALATVLRGTAGFEVVSVYSSAEDAVSQMPIQDVDLVLVDLSLGGMSGVECMSRLHQRRPDLLLCVITVWEDPDQIFASLRAGANGYLLKKTPWSTIVAELDELTRGGSPMSPAVARKVTQFFQQQTPQPLKTDDLSDREREVLHQIASGLPYKQIAGQLGVATDTIRAHVRNIYKKLQVHSRAQATAVYLNPSLPRR